MGWPKRILLTFDEALELRRAMELIEQEDGAADVNMDAKSVANKVSARRKLERAMNYRDPWAALKDAPSVDVRDIK